MMRNRGLFGALATFASLAFVMAFGHSSALAQLALGAEVAPVSGVTSEISVEKTDTVAETSAAAPTVVCKPFPRLEVVKGHDVLEFIRTNSGVLFGFADGGEFVWVTVVGDQPVLMVDSFLQEIEIVENQLHDQENFIEIKGVFAGKGVQGKLFLAAFADQERDESNIHLVFELSNPFGFDGIRFVFDSETGAIYSPRCICTARTPSGPDGPCGVVDCDRNRPCGQPDRQGGCWWEPPEGPRLIPISILAPIVDSAER